MNLALKIFHNLHSHDMTDVMMKSFANLQLTKDESLSILKSNLFLTLHHRIILVLLQNDGIICNNVPPEQLWQALQLWCKHNVNNEDITTCGIAQTARTRPRLRMSTAFANTEYEWLELMKIFVPYIRFDQMDPTFFMQHIEPIPNSYNILSPQRKYDIVKQFCLRLSQEKKLQQQKIHVIDQHQPMLESTLPQHQPDLKTCPSLISAKLTNILK